MNAYATAVLVKWCFRPVDLQPPFFDPEADDAANYGAIGAIIGHEIGHQFDDRGSKFDARGSLNNWWTDEDRHTFERRTACIVDQFNTLDVGGGLHHNGKQVLGEALGDLSGLKIAYQAYRRSLAGKSEPPAIDGFTADQRFFIAFARIVGNTVPRGGEAPAAKHRQSPAPAVPGERDAAEHARIPQGFRVQGRRPDGAPCGAAMPCVVSTPLLRKPATGCLASASGN